MPQTDLTQGHVPLSLARLTAPMMMGVSSSILVQVLEMGFIGQLSTAHVAAITFTFPLTMVLTSIALGISIGTSSVIARSVGQQSHSRSDSDDVQRLGTHSLILVTVAMSILAALCWLTLDPIFLALGASAEMLPLIHSYLDIYLPGSVFFTTSMILGSIMRANGSATAPGSIMTVGSLVHLVLDPILIFGWFGLPAMELSGAAIAMTVTRFATLIVTLVFVFKGNMVLNSEHFGLFRFNQAHSACRYSCDRHQPYRPSDRRLYHSIDGELWRNCCSRIWRRWPYRISRSNAFIRALWIHRPFRRPKLRG